jgi:hypothetical protein
MAIKPLQNAPLWPPSPSNQQAASPGPQPEEKKVQTKTPPHQDNSSHHSSPTPGMKQTPVIPTPPASTKKAIGKIPEVPMHKTKHSEPVGRPKKRNPY